MGKLHQIGKHQNRHAKHGSLIRMKANTLNQRSTPTETRNLPTTLASTVYDRLRRDILLGVHKPEANLRISALSKHYRIGQIPIREALNRLWSEALVERIEQRGFRVAPVSNDDLLELTKTRCWVEATALRESIAAHSQAWEEGVVLAFHRLSRVPRSLSAKIYTPNPEWEALHRAFHESLIAGCGSRWMIAFCLQLADQTYRYRQIAYQRVFAGRGAEDGHRAIMEAAFRGDLDTSVQLLQAHLRFTAQTILAKGRSLGAGGGRPRAKTRGQRRAASEPRPRR